MYMSNFFSEVKDVLNISIFASGVHSSRVYDEEVRRPEDSHVLGGSLYGALRIHQNQRKYSYARTVGLCSQQNYFIDFVICSTLHSHQIAILIVISVPRSYERPATEDQTAYRVAICLSLIS